MPVEHTDKPLIAVSQHSVFLAEAAISGCANCTSSASVSLVRVLDKLGNHPEGIVDYIFPVLASCPYCRSSLDELSLVLPKAD
jgi:hypothetical protein